MPENINRENLPPVTVEEALSQSVLDKSCVEYTQVLKDLEAEPAKVKASNINAFKDQSKKRQKVKVKIGHLEGAQCLLPLMGSDELELLTHDLEEVFCQFSACHSFGRLESKPEPKKKVQNGLAQKFANGEALTTEYEPNLEECMARFMLQQPKSKWLLSSITRVILGIDKKIPNFGLAFNWQRYIVRKVAAKKAVDLDKLLKHFNNDASVVDSISVDDQPISSNEIDLSCLPEGAVLSFDGGSYPVVQGVDDERKEKRILAQIFGGTGKSNSETKARANKACEKAVPGRFQSSCEKGGTQPEVLAVQLAVKEAERQEFMENCTEPVELSIRERFLAGLMPEQQKKKAEDRKARYQAHLARQGDQKEFPNKVESKGTKGYCNRKSA